jgi:uncharacterized protein YydD (DUF2326 family)
MVAHALIPVLWRLKQEDHKFKASLGYIIRSQKEGREEEIEGGGGKLFETKNVAELRCMKSYWEKEELDLLYVI